MLTNASNADLTRGLITAVAGLIFGLTLGAAVVRCYDARGFTGSGRTSSPTYSSP